MTNDDMLKVQLLDTIDDDWQKVDIICSLQDDEAKIELLDKLESNSAKGIVLSSLTNDDKKLELLRTIQIPNKGIVIASMRDDNKKIELLDELQYEGDKVEVISSLKDTNIKLTLLDRVQDKSKASIILSISDDENRIGAIEKIDDDYFKARVIKRIKSTEKKIELLDGLSEEAKKEIILSIEDEEKRAGLIEKLDNDSFKIEIILDFKDDERRIDLLHLLTQNAAKVTVISSLNSDDKKIELLKTVPESWSKVKVISSLLNDDKKIEMLDTLNDDLAKLQIVVSLNDKGKQKELLSKPEYTKHVNNLRSLYQNNNDVLEQIDMRLLQEKYTQTLGLDKINLIICYSNIQQQILNLSDKQYEAFQKCLNNYLNTNRTDEWNVLANNILQNIEEYSELIENISDFEDIDIAKLTKIIQDRNTFQIKRPEDIENFEQIKREQCDKIIESSHDVQQVKEAVMQKIFGHSFEYAKMIVEKFGEDIEHIADGDEKDYVMSLKEMLDVDQIDVLHQIYAECSEIELIDKTLMERSLKTEYGKLFNEGLWEPQNSNRINDEEFEKMMQIDGVDEQAALYEELKGLDLYNAGKNFKMIVTSVAPLLERPPVDYKKDWNRPSVASHHFCASYIRNDCIKTIPVLYLCYGFTDMKEDSLVLSGAVDIGSSGVSSFVSGTTHDEKYYSPDNLVENTDAYNEIDFRRIQGGTKKQPDYIVAFKRNGKIANIEEIIKASKNWEGSLPIVIVDVDECEKDQARESKEETREQVVDIQDLEENDNRVNTDERQEGISQIKQLYNKLKEVVMKREGANNGR